MAFFFVTDRYRYRNRWIRAMRDTAVPMRLIDGPSDPNSGRHMAQRYLEVIPNPDVVMLADDIAHWPQIEAPEDVLRHFLAHVERVVVRAPLRPVPRPPWLRSSTDGATDGREPSQIPAMGDGAGLVARIG